MTIERNHGAPPPGAPFMNAVRWILFAALLLLAAASIALYVGGRSGGGTGAGGAAARASGYYCPMHPSYTSDRPGECPICSMTLEPIPAHASGHEGHAGEIAIGAGGPGGASGAVPGLTSIHLTPERIQLIGVRTARVERRAVGGRLELVGAVAPDEGSLRRVQIRAGGSVQKLHVSETGVSVRAGAPLLDIYSPELYQSELEYLIELGAQWGSSSGTHTGGALAAGRERLRLLGVPDEEVARLERARTASTAITLRAPVGGTVLERSVVQGQNVDPMTPLFTIADLSRVWVVADLYEMDFGRVRAGDRAEFRVEGLPGRRFEGRVAFVYPTVSPETRTIKVRFTLENPGGHLRPGMYGSVAVATAARPTLAVPAEAVVRSGARDYAFLAHAGGRFEPRLVTVGTGDGEWVPVLSGLAAGDTVVTSASFLLDSESRLRAAIAGADGMGAMP
jgi:Cu(I)/Ag(I) efflux system membrane fusion protein